METKTANTFRLTAEGQALLKAIAQKLGLSQGNVLEILIREKAKQEKLWK